jgi:heme-degrading monooxygenase HmoA
MMNMPSYQLAEINIGRMKGVNINDPIMQEFVENLNRVNQLAESSEGFVWRLKDESNNATNLNPYNDEQVIINISVWESVEALEQFTFKSLHTDFLKRRKEWFQQYGKMYFAMWWIPAGQYPSVEEAVARLAYLQENGASEKVFTFREKFAKPL